jgi:dihydroflavonol-4-reductase
MMFLNICVYLRSMILITGANGLVGSHLLLELLQNEVHQIKAIYRDEVRKNQVLEIFKHYQPSLATELYEKIIWIKGDLLDVPFLDEIMNDVEVVYHCAALVSFQRKDFSKLMLINRQGTSNVVDACLDHGIKTIIHVSSTAALGAKPGKMVTEETRWEKEEDTSGYSISKYSSEKEIWRGKEEGLNVIVVNPCLILGAGSWEESSLTLFNAVKKGLKFYTPGGNAVVDARYVAQAMYELEKNKVYNQRFLLVNHNLSFFDLFSKIAIRIGKNPPKYKVNRILMGFSWRLASIYAWLNGSPSSITKESAKSAFKTTQYDASKIQEQLPNLYTYTLEEMIDNTVKGQVTGKK